MFLTLIFGEVPPPLIACIRKSLILVLVRKIIGFFICMKHKQCFVFIQLSRSPLRHHIIAFIDFPIDTDDTYNTVTRILVGVKMRAVKLYIG